MELNVHNVAHFAINVVVGAAFAIGMATMLSTFLWTWLAWALSFLIGATAIPELNNVGDAIYNKSTDAAAWCIRKFRAGRTA